jgi:molybdopterin-guanine dinucleotide biosynthesis protein A
MGTTKALILQNNHLPVMVHIANLLRPLVESVHISVRSDQDDVIDLCKKENLSMLFDETPGLCGGPAAGMLAAKNFDSQCTWIVVACDYYNLEFSTFINLLACHEPGITCFRSTKDEYHDPLLAIWDADDLVTLEESVKAGRSGPCYTIRLLSSMNRLTIVDPIDRRWVLSANTAEEWENVAKIQTI